MAPRKAYYNDLNHKQKDLLKKHEKEIVQAYEDAFLAAYEELIVTTMDDDKYNEKAYVKAKVIYTNQIYDKIKVLSDKYNVKLSEDFKHCVTDFFDMEKEFKNDEQYKFLKEQVAKNVDVTNEKAIKELKSGKIYEADKNGNFVDLDDRLWNASVASGKKLQDAIASCLAQGMGPADMAKVIAEFGKEGHKTWSSKKIREKLGPGYARSHSGGLDYAALRLARTTHTHLNQLQVIHSKNNNPYIDKVKYHSVHAANRTCKMCAERDGQLFDVDKVPLDHPNGMCWLEQVFMASDEQMADDLAKWIRGEKNSGIMDKAYPHLVGTPDYKPKEEKPKVPEKPKAEEYKEQESLQVQEYIEHFKRLIGDDPNTQSLAKLKQAEDFVERAGKTLDECFPDIIKEAYYKTTEDIRAWTQAQEGAYWSRNEKRVQFNITKHRNSKVEKYGIAEFDTWFHENGHAMDSILGEKYDQSKGLYNGKGKLSAQKPYINALKKDFENQKINLRKKYLKEQGYKNVDQMSEAELKQRIPDKNLNALYNYYLSGKHKTSGIQDVVEGMSNCEISVQWGHGKQYWNRGNREQEYASEAWANMLGSYSDPETYEYMKEYFPNAMRMQEKIIKTAVNSVYKKK